MVCFLCCHGGDGRSRSLSEALMGQNISVKDETQLNNFENDGFKCQFSCWKGHLLSASVLLKVLQGPNVQDHIENHGFQILFELGKYQSLKLKKCLWNKMSGSWLIFHFGTEPSFYFGETEYTVDESDGYVEVKVWRTGTDLSKTATVTVRSRKSDPVSAEGKECQSKTTVADIWFLPNKKRQKITFIHTIFSPPLFSLPPSGFRLCGNQP